MTAVYKLAMAQALLISAKENIKFNWDEPADRNGPAIGLLQDMRMAVVELEAHFTLKAIDRVLAAIQDGKCTAANLLRDIGVIDGRLRDELDETHLFVVSRDNAKYLDDSKPLFGDEVSSKFPSASYDIEEAGKCLGLKRSTACVSHLMRALEIALSAMAKPFNVSTDHKNWHNVIDEIEKGIKGMNSSLGPTWKDDQEFHAGAASHFRMLKDGWRNHAMHARFKYTEEEAEEIYRSTRAFIRHLSQRLSEELPA